MIFKSKRAFTIVELIIAMAIFTIAMTMLYKLQTSSSRVYMISAWKQDKTRKLQYLIKILKEDLGEASKIVQVVGGSTLPTINDCPLKYDTNGTGPDIIEFTRNHFNDAGSVEYQILCELKLNNRNLTYIRRKVAGSAPDYKLAPREVKLEDVDRVDVDVKPIVYSKKTGYEYVLEGAIDSSDEEETGALLNLSFILTPPGNVKIRRPLIETIKKKIFVKAIPF
jgi:prepilin-type N-terminal cleavage/methylation domain-containing protein